MLGGMTWSEYYTLNIKNLFLLEFSKYSRASSMGRASAVKMELLS